jgi:hypothetical protein
MATATAGKTRGAKTTSKRANASKTKAGKSKTSPGRVGARKLVVLKPEFVEDLKKVFEKHSWPGHPIGFVANPAMATLGLDPCDPGPLTCPNGETPKTQWVHCPDGRSILEDIVHKPSHPSLSHSHLGISADDPMGFGYV